MKDFKNASILRELLRIKVNQTRIWEGSATMEDIIHLQRFPFLRKF